jgi:hypothetical protein
MNTSGLGRQQLTVTSASETASFAVGSRPPVELMFYWISAERRDVSFGGSLERVFDADGTSPNRAPEHCRQ